MIAKRGIVFPGFFMILLFFSWDLSAQNIPLGEVKGIVKDSSLNYLLPSATVSVYKKNDKLQSYTLTDSRGTFSLTGLPLGDTLFIHISFIGYATYSSSFVLESSKPVKNIGLIYLEKSSKTLENINVYAPVIMKGDTLEFNPEAFELDKNAVAEDLLKKLPGVIVWGDGTITVNGRQIEKLLVNGKPFMTGDTKIATQNIPKNAIEKVQVYQEAINEYNPYDSITSINIQLRKNSRKGYFGKISASLGTDEKYEGVFTQSAFTPKTQISLVGQTNNVNRPANDLNSILKNASFKGTSAQVEYDNDFNLPGRNEQMSGGFLMTHDFNSIFEETRQNRLTVKSFYNDVQNHTIKETQTTNYFGLDSTFLQRNQNGIQNDPKSWNADISYDMKKYSDTFHINAQYSHTELNNDEVSFQELLSPANLKISRGSQQINSFATEDIVHFKTAYKHVGFKSGPRFLNWGIKYDFTSRIPEEERGTKISVENELDPQKNRHYNRAYSLSKTRNTQTISFRLGNFSDVLFYKERFFSRLNIFLENDMDFLDEKANNHVKDFDTSNHIYFKNQYLSVKSDHKELNISPGLFIGTNFLKIFSGRFQKSVDFQLRTKAIFHTENFRSQHAFQSYNNSYSGILPSAGVSYINFQYGNFSDNYNIQFNSSYKNPMLEELVPLTDSSNIYFLQKGNILLKPQKDFNLTLSYRRNNHGKRRRGLSYGGNLQWNKADNFIGDSLLLDELGRYIRYATNFKSQQTISGGLFFKNAYNLGGNQLQVQLNLKGSYIKNPGYFGFVNSPQVDKTITNIFRWSDSASIYYLYKDILVINLFQGFNRYRAKQTGPSGSNYRNNETITRMGLGVKMNKKITLNSTFSVNSYSGNIYNNRIAIWNAFVSVRFLKSNNLELKLSALDLLNQNKGIIYYGNSYSVTRGTTNLLHQYFMVGISFYPRKFGKNEKRR